MGIKLRHTYTNSQLTENIFQDYRSLQWTEACHKEGNSIILVDPKLKDFLHEKFPLYNFVWSTSLCCKNIDLINERSKNDMVVLDYTLNHSDIFDKLEHPENIEIMLSEACPDECPYRYSHYQVESRFILNEEKDRDLILTCEHPKLRHPTFYDYLEKNKATLTVEQINELHNKYGLINFKIAGRDYDEVTYIESLMYYLVKPEYRDYLRQLLLLEIFNLWIQ